MTVFEGRVSLYKSSCREVAKILPHALVDAYLVHMRLPGYGMVVLHIPRAAVDEVVRAKPGSRAPSSPDFAALRHNVLGRTWLSMARTFAESAIVGLFARSPASAHHFEQMLLHGLVDTQTVTCPGTVRQVPDLPRVLRRAIAHCVAYAGDPISVADLARAAGTSVRSLQQAFRGHLGITPMDYLRRIRLDRAHHDLVAIAEGRAGGTVTDVALRWGFTHLGRFAALYRDVHGRLPVQTLRGGEPPDTESLSNKRVHVVRSVDRGEAFAVLR